MARDMMTSISDVPQLYQIWGTRVHVPDGVSGYLYQVPQYPCTWDLGTGYHCTRYPIPGHLGTHVPGTLYRGTQVHVPDGVPGYLYQVPGYPCTWYPVQGYPGTCTRQKCHIRHYQREYYNCNFTSISRGRRTSELELGAVGGADEAVRVYWDVGRVPRVSCSPDVVPRVPVVLPRY